MFKKHIGYTEFKLQSYFMNQDIDIKIIRNVFKFRNRMLDFGQHFRGNREYLPCIFGCLNESDCQTHMFSCEKVCEQNTYSMEYYSQLYKEV